MGSRYVVPVPNASASEMGSPSGAFTPKCDKELAVFASSLNHEYDSSARACSAAIAELIENEDEDDTDTMMFAEFEQEASCLEPPGFNVRRTVGRSVQDSIHDECVEMEIPQEKSSPNDNFNSLQFSNPTNPSFDVEMSCLEPANSFVEHSCCTNDLDADAPPELSNQSPSFELNLDMDMPFLKQLGIPGKASLSSSPFLDPPVSPSYADIFDLNQLLRSGNISSFLAIPLLCEFERILVEKTMDNVVNRDGCVVQYRLKSNGQILRNFDEVHRYLMENNIEIPISFFCFDPEILIHAVHKTDPNMLLNEDLSGGQERVPISVNCSKKRQGRLSNFITKSFLDENLKKSLSPHHEEGFLVCCNCPNDCSDKLNCPCFLKTLDNCSKMTRQAVGDENVGYNYQRLEKEFLSGIFECNKLCGCHKQTCFNRVVQNGMFCKLQLFMTRFKGWGVRTLADIPKGTFICTYAGRIVGEDYAEQVSKNWSDGNWKYLSELRIGEEGKPDYEEEVIEPEMESPEVVNNEVSGSKEDESTRNVPESSDTPAHAATPIPIINSDCTPADVELPHGLEAEMDDPRLYSIRSRFPMERSPNEFTLMAQLTMRALLKSGSDSSGGHPTPLRNTQYIFRRDYDAFYSEENHSNLSDEEEYDEAVDEYRQQPLRPEGTSQIPTEVAHNVARSIKLREKPKPIELKPDLKLSVPNPRPVKPRTIGKKPRTKRVKAAVRTWSTRKPRTFSKSKRLGGGKESESVHPLLDFSLNIDGVKDKNVGGYINHSCNPNIFPQYVFWDCHDLRLPVIAFFASRNIRRGEELSWNYKYELDQFVDPAERSSTQQTQLPCYCGEDNCKRTMYTS